MTIPKTLLPILFLLQVVCGWSVTTANAAPVLILEDGFTTLPVDEHAEVLVETGGYDDIGILSADVGSGRFGPVAVDTLNWGVRPEPVWLRVRIEDRRKRSSPFMLVMNYTQVDRLDFFQCRQTRAEFEAGTCSDASLKSQAVLAGRLHTAERRARASAGDVFRLDPGESSEGVRYVTFWLRGQTSGSLQMSATLQETAHYDSSARISTLVLGLYFGALLVLILYNLFLALSTLYAPFFWYVLYMTSWVVFQGFLSGFGFTFFGDWLPESVGPRIVPMAILLFGEFALFFAITFLRVADISRTLARVCTIFALSGMAMAMVMPLLSYSVSLKIAMLFFTPIWLILEVYVGIRAYRVNPRTAMLYLISWIFPLLGAAIVAARTFGLLPTNPFTLNAMYIGSLVEALLMSLTMADMINQLRNRTELQAREMERVNAELRRIDQMKDDFLANTSHELRTPLNGIIGLAEANLTDGSQRLSDEQRDNLQMIVASGRRLSNLVNDILDFSKMRHEELSLACVPLDLRAVTTAICSLSMPSVRGRDIQLHNNVPDDLPAVMADENRLQQILHNLVGNALKFTPEGSVSVAAAIEGERVVVSVEDTGIGIPADRIDSIFVSFNQGDGSISRTYGGTGLGLTITRQLVELHGGTISVRSEPGKGSVFSFTLALAAEGVAGHETLSPDRPPVITAPSKVSTTAVTGSSGQMQSVADRPVSPVANAPVNAGRSLLVVDDEAVNRQVLRSQLRSAGYDVIEAADGEKALEILSGGAKVDLILLDVMMPRLSGYDTCRRIRAAVKPSDLPVIFLTAKSRTEDVLAGFEAGGNDYLLKPFSRDELLARINIHLELLTSQRLLTEYSHSLELRVEERTRALAETQQTLVQKQKMAALGVLTAGIAHEINNPNNFIVSGAQNAEAFLANLDSFVTDLLADEGDQDLRAQFAERFDRIRLQLGLVLDGARRIRGIVEGLHVFTGHGEDGRKRTDPVSGLEQTVRLMNVEGRDTLSVVTDFRDRPSAYCWPAELNQVFMNLLSNAEYAIRLRLPGGDAEYRGIIRLGSRLEGNELHLLVEDNGIGMDASTLEKAMDPFFTTKPVGSGAGLGLSISHDICVKHGGRLLLDSSPGQGTRATVILPVEPVNIA
jgi:signal transduction histidine kinase